MFLILESKRDENGRFSTIKSFIETSIVFPTDDTIFIFKEYNTFSKDSTFSDFFSSFSKEKVNLKNDSLMMRRKDENFNILEEIKFNENELPFGRLFISRYPLNKLTAFFVVCNKDYNEKDFFNYSFLKKGAFTLFSFFITPNLIRIGIVFNDLNLGSDFCSLDYNFLFNEMKKIPNLLDDDFFNGEQKDNSFAFNLLRIIIQNSEIVFSRIRNKKVCYLEEAIFSFINNSSNSKPTKIEEDILYSFCKYSEQLKNVSDSAILKIIEKIKGDIGWK